MSEHKERRPMPTREQRIERLKLKLARQEASARKKAREDRKRDRKGVTHANVVAGAILRTRPEAFGLDAAAVRAVLDREVTREHDRAALDLPPLPPE